MQKIQFTNGTTINGASTFNAMQDNVEDVFNGETPMGSIVVEDIECKNKFNKNGNLTALAGVYGIALSNFINSSMLGKEVTISCNTVMFVMRFGDNESTGIILESQYSNGITFVVTQEILNVADVKYLSMLTLDEQWITYKEQQLGYELQSELGTERTKYVEYKEYDNSKIIKNEKTSSEIDTYSCNYINNILFKKITETDLNNLTTSGIYTLNAKVNVPAGSAYYNVAVFYYGENNNYAYMIATKIDGPNIYVRYKYETWQAWQKIVPTAI